MKFITEEDLRDLYRKEPFTDYNLESGARLTPGARQFLVDRGIHIADTDYNGKKINIVEKPMEVKMEKKVSCKNKKLFGRMKSLEAMFLLTEEELLSRDVCLAQSVIKLSKQFTGIRNKLKNNTPIENLSCIECTGINCINFSEELEDCFEITEFHIQLEKGKEIILLHRMRCELYELIYLIEELNEGSVEEKELFEDVTSKVNQIINSLSQLICTTFGGKKCQKQN